MPIQPAPPRRPGWRAVPARDQAAMGGWAAAGLALFAGSTGALLAGLLFLHVMVGYVPVAVMAAAISWACAAGAERCMVRFRRRLQRTFTGREQA